MRLSWVILATLLWTACPHPAPFPTPTPPSGDGLCGLSEPSYDTLSDALVDALGDDVSWSRRLDAAVAENGHDLVLCMMKNVFLDLREAPAEKSRAQDWLEKNS